MSMKLYIIHGWAYSVEPWNETVSTLARLGIEAEILRVPGLTSPSDRSWTIDEYVAWLDSKLSGIDAPIVLGHSNGGRIALHYLATHPGRFKQLILLASAGIELDSQKLSLKRRVFLLASKILAPLKHVPYLRKIVYRFLKSDYGSAPPNMQKTLANMLASDKSFDPSGITTPTTLLYGTDDATTSPALGEKLSQQLQNATFKQIDGWNHAPYRAHPEQLANEIKNVMESAV